MTVITKPLSEKKGDTLILPLVNNDFLRRSTPDDAEAQSRNVVILRTRIRRISISATLCLLLTSLIVVTVGIFGGKFLYNQYISVQVHKFRGYAQVPMPAEVDQTSFMRNQKDMYDSAFLRGLPPSDSDTSTEDKTITNKIDDNFDNIMRNYFREGFEIDLNDEGYEKIDVPDFRDGRSGRFIHDFNNNITGIIDITGNRCFVMPLNRGTVLPPKSLFDLIHKMWDGYYKVNTKIVRESMRVVTPPLNNPKNVGTYISNECEGRPIYKLEKFVGGVVKRSIRKEVKFAQFSGNGITEFEIVNLDEVESFEKENH